jgi:HAE1 family hydrophobic/amphiphilic exporter-1
LEKKHNWITRLTLFFIDNKYITILFFLAIILGGAWSFTQIRREGFPQVPVKVVVVTTVYRGAGAAEVERSITSPVEASLKDIKSIKQINSSSSDNASTVQLTLDERSNLDATVQDITSKVSKIELPTEAEKPQIFQPSTGNSAFIFGLSGNLSEAELLQQGNIFQREMSQVKGVKQVKLASAYTAKVRLTFDPAKLAAIGVDPTKISSTIEANNLNFPAGALVVGDQSSAVLVQGSYSSLDELKAIPLPTVTGGTARLDSVATVAPFIDQANTINRVGYRDNGKLVSRTALVYNVDIRSDADILHVQKELDTTLAHLQSDGTLSSNLKVARLVDQAADTQRQIHEIQSGAIGELWHGIGPLGVAGLLLGGIWLLMLAMLLFVNWRTALIAGLAIPLSFLFTVLCLYLAGITLNTLTLFSMILVLGLIVDPAIVVLEAVQRAKDQGFTGREAVISSMDSIGPGVFMSVLTSIVVFVPFGVVSGVFGAIIKFIPITVIPALVASFLVPIAFLAALGGRFVKAHPHASAKTDEEDNLWGVSRWFQRANLRILSKLWAQILIITVLAVLPIAVAMFFLGSGKVKSVQFSKPNDTLIASATIDYPASSSPAFVNDLAKQTEAAIAKQPEVSSFYYLSQAKDSFTIFMNLTPLDDRIKTSDQLAKDLQPQLPQNGTTVFATAESLGVGPPTSQFPVQLQVFDADLKKLEAFSTHVADYAKTIPGVTRVVDGYGAEGTTLTSITLDHNATTAAGLSTATVGGQVASLLEDQKVTQIQQGDGKVDVVAIYGTATPANLEALSNMRLASPTGIIRLGQIAKISQGPSASSISRLDGNRYATIKVGAADGADVNKIQSELNTYSKSQLSAFGLKSTALESKGQGDDIAKSFGDLFKALALSLILSYFIFAVFFKSWLQPLIITFAVPLAFLGVFPALWFVKGQFGFLEILGMITLVSIVENVGTFVIDYANRKQREGHDKKEAIALATAVRFRPIFLTKVTALGALLPLAILSPFWRGLASVIIAGILTSGVLSLFSTPILYSWFDAWGRFPDWVRTKLHLHPKPHERLTPLPRQNDI